jgi:hypothetical protein
MPLTAGMIFSWLYSSSTIKDINASQKDFSFKYLLSQLNPILKYTLLLLGLYAVVNFINTFSVHSGDSWVDFDLDYKRLRGISGFWLLFYTVGLTSSYLKVKWLKKDH